MTPHATTTAALRAFAASEPLELRVVGGCMRPLLPDGGRIAVRRRRLYLPGDVVAFRRGDGRLLVHRVLGFTLARDGAAMVAQGDRLSRADAPVGLDQVIGRVMACDGRPVQVSVRQRLRSGLRFLRAALGRSTTPWPSATRS
jgi:hypothetical protein